MVIFKDFCNAEKTNKNKHNVEVILTTFLCTIKMVNARFSIV